MPEIKIKWQPQPRQLTFLKACGLAHPFEGGQPTQAVADVIGYGGSAGGGKSDSLIALAMIAGLTYPGIKIGYFRREFPQLEGPGGAIMRSQELMTSWAKYNATKHRWTMPTKAILQFCHCKNEDDMFNYQSQQFDILLFDEGTQFTETIYRYLQSRNRATTNNKAFVPFTAIATNPGGEGHGWFKEQFVDIGAPEEVYTYEVQPGTFENHIFIPAKLADNMILEKRDPRYRQRLESQSEIVRRQLLEGDWDAYAGQYYPEFSRSIHVIKPFEIPDHWKRVRSLDYGLDMTACYWWAIDQQGKCHAYRELCEKNLNLSQAARKILSMTPAGEEIAYTVASPDLWNRRQETGASGAEVMIKAGLKGLIRANNSRVPGWRCLREYLSPYEDEFGEKTAKLVIFNTCTQLIKNLPLLQHDENNPEDAADKPHEVTHSPESVRYFVMSRPSAASLKTDTKRDMFLYRTESVENSLLGGEVTRSYIEY